MVNPVPGKGISTPYGIRGSYWSCNKNSSGQGIHTGVDYAAPSGQKCVAARDGTVRYVNFGSAFGTKQLAVVANGTRDFYAHMRKRSVADGAKVKAGDKVGEVGAEGNVTGAHLHFERHSVDSGGWSCGIIVNPQPSIDFKPPSSGGGSGAGEEVPIYINAKRTKDVKLKAGQWTPISWESGSKQINPNNPGVDVSGPYMATLSVNTERPNDAGFLQVSWVEWDTAKGEAAETSATDSLGAVSQGVSAKVGNVQKGRRLRARVRVTGQKDITLKTANLAIITW